MADRKSFQERLVRIAPRVSRGSRPESASHPEAGVISWIVSVVVDIAFNGWAFFLSGLAFVVFAGLFFLDFFGIEVGLMVAVALAAFLFFVLKSEL
ncbi:hypothetical protein AAFO92_06130 [Roseovarius sp. CAU 1744]|uniref:hypothetical protein n=1 Tax=Roseovarius sp. CAU 1744 TaxID=3140368 RepID=UPI00325A959A